MKRALIVDDKEENLYYLEALLKGHGFEVDTACHGAEALVKARRQPPPSLIISDLLMPVMDGYTLLRRWKSDPQLRNIPFIVYTATYTQPEDEQLAMSLGANAFILKPTEPEIFLQRITEVETSGAPDPHTASLDPTEANPELLKHYSETLIRKLEEKMFQLEEANRRLEEDIAERRTSEAKLREQAALLDKAQDAILVRDLEHRILYWNKSAERLYGWKAEEALGRSIKDLLYRDPTAFLEATQTALEQGEWTGEIEQFTREDKPIAVEAHWTTVFDDEGNPKSILAINTDITERKKLEQQLLRAQRMESIGTLAGGMAHDLNNLLSPVLMGVDLLRHMQLPPNAMRILTDIRQSALRGTDLVKQVLSFARGVEGARVPVPPSSLIEEIESFIANTFPKNILFETKIPEDVWPVIGDATQLNQILLNLCVNARDAMPEGGTMTLTARNLDLDQDPTHPSANGRHVLIEVTDQGCGMPPEVMDRAFEPFFTTKDPGKGTGLGLSTVTGIVRSHGGFIDVSSTPGKGSSFKVFLPAAEEAASPEVQSSDREKFPRGEGERILLVDDEASILAITKQTLETFGYSVVTAADGAEALALYASHSESFDAVITDMMMPIMDGPALAAAIQRINPEARIIAASGLSSDDHASQAEDAGVKHFLSKPYTAAHLLTLIKQVLHPEG